MVEANYQFEPVAGVLADRVEGVWHLSHGGDEAPQMIAPDGCCEILLHRGAPPREKAGDRWHPQPAALLYGPLNRALALQLSGPMDVLGIRLHPWAVGTLGPAPAKWRNRAVSLDDVLGADRSEAFLMQARRSATPADFLCETEADLDTALVVRPALAISRRLIEALKTGEARSIRDLSQLAGATERTVSRTFERACGLTAGDMIRILRFHQARDAIKAGLPLIEAADLAGYADQAHMTRDFRRFAGITPVPARQPAAFDVFYPQTGQRVSDNARRGHAKDDQHG